MYTTRRFLEYQACDIGFDIRVTCIEGSLNEQLIYYDSTETKGQREFSSQALTIEGLTHIIYHNEALSLASSISGKVVDQKRAQVFWWIFRI